jgi:hypothetical protein
MRIQNSDSGAAMLFYYDVGAIPKLSIGGSYQIGHLDAGSTASGQLGANRVLTLKSFNESTLGGVVFDVGGTERGRFHSNGNFGVNNNTAPNPIALNTLTTADSLARLAVSTDATTNKGILVQGVASQTADLFQAQSSTGTVLASISSAGNLTVQNATINGHIITANSSGSTTVAKGAASDCSGTGSASISGNDTSGTVTINTSTGTCTAGTLATVTFANAFGAAPRVVLTPANIDGAALEYYYSSTTTTVAISTRNNPSASTTYLLSYLVMQ